jgi:hypothetical protein
MIDRLYPSGFMNPTSSTAYVIQLSDGSAPCKIKAKWLPTTLSASKFNWKIEAKTNGGTTSLWSSSSGTFSNIDEYKDTTWNQGTTLPTRSFVCNVGFDYNKNSQYDASEKTRSIDVEIVQLGELKLTEIDKNGADFQNVDSVGNQIGINTKNDTTKEDTTPASPNDTITLITYNEDQSQNPIPTQTRVKLEMSWVNSSISSYVIRTIFVGSWTSLKVGRKLTEIVVQIRLLN